MRSQRSSRRKLCFEYFERLIFIYSIACSRIVMNKTSE